MGYENDSIGVGGAIWVSAIALLVASGIAISNIIKHYKNLYYKEAQNKLFLILFLPITG